MLVTSKIIVVVQEKPHMFQFVPNEKQVCAQILRSSSNLSNVIGVIVLLF
jgi:hypothetical protein